VETEMANDRERKQRAGGKPSPWGKPAKREDTPTLEDVEKLGTLLDRIVEAGDGIMLSRTSDGGALVVTLYAGEARHKQYCASSAEVWAAFDALWQAYPEGT
jgi:hypothetical protein